MYIRNHRSKEKVNKKSCVLKRTNNDKKKDSGKDLVKFPLLTLTEGV